MRPVWPPTLVRDRETVDLRLQRLEQTRQRTGGSVGGGGRRFATAVVGAHDRLDTSAADFDYVCTGSADDVVINQALHDVAFGAPPGGLVLLSEGSFNLTDILLIYGNCDLRGMGIRATELLTTASGTLTSGIHLSDVGITVADLAWFKSGGTVTNGILVDGSSECSLRSCQINGGDTRAVYLNGVVAHIIGCDIVSGAGAGSDIVVNGAGAAALVAATATVNGTSTTGGGAVAVNLNVP